MQTLKDRDGMADGFAHLTFLLVSMPSCMIFTYDGRPRGHHSQIDDYDIQLRL